MEIIGDETPSDTCRLRKGVTEEILVVGKPHVDMIVLAATNILGERRSETKRQWMLLGWLISSREKNV